MFYGSKWCLLRIRWMYMFECLYAHVRVCMTLFVSPRDAVGWTTVRGTGPEHKKSRHVYTLILDCPMSPTPTPYFDVT